MADQTTIHGYCASGFESVREEFERNFRERGELGAAVSLTQDGETIVDLWGGIADEASGRPWKEDTLAVVFSTTKGLAAICIHILVDRSALSFDAPVAQYWPEFGQNGKEGVTVAMALSHQAGVPVWQQELPDGALHDWDFAAARLAAEAPLWEPGTMHGYHGVTIGWIAGELVRRTSGMTIGTFFRKEVASALDADAWIGLPESEHHRVSTLILCPPDLKADFFRKIDEEPDWFGAKLVTNAGGDIGPDTVNSPRRWSMEHPSAGGTANARALARIYAPLAQGGVGRQGRLVSADAIERMKTVRAASDCDTVLRLPTTFTLGFSKTWGDRRLGPGSHVILGEHAFGTPGMGGSLGFADPEAGISFGYVMNRLGSGVGLNDRGQSLVDATYRTLGYREAAPGHWTR